jgi:hypothetical protein
MESLLNVIRRIILTQWLWEVLACFYLVIYTFWVPALFSRLSIVVPIFYLDLIVSLSLLKEGFLRGLELEYGIIAPVVLPFKRVVGYQAKGDS